MSPICSRIGRGLTRDPFNGTWDFRMSFLVSLPVTFLAYGNSQKLQNICTWISGGSKTPLRTSCFSLTQLNARCCLSAWRFPRKFKDMKWKIAWRCVGKNPANSPGGPVSAQHLLVITRPSSQSLNTSHVCEFLAWWLFTSLLCFQWSFSNWVISFEALTNLTTHSHTLFQAFCLDTFLYEAWHWHHFEGFLKQDSFPIQSLGSILTQGDPQCNLTSKISKIHYDSHNECYLSDELWRNATFSPRKKSCLWRWRLQHLFGFGPQKRRSSKGVGFNDWELKWYFIDLYWELVTTIIIICRWNMKMWKQNVITPA